MIPKILLSAAALAAVLAAPPAMAQSRGTGALTSPAAVVAQFEQFVKASDVDGLMTLFAEDTLLVPQPGAEGVQGLDAIRPIAQGFVDAAQDMEMSLRSVYQNDDTALIIVDWTMSTPNGEGALIEVSATATDVLKQRPDGTWYYLIDNPFGVGQ